MPKTVFIADLHLDKRYPKALSVFQQYFQQLSQQSVDAVYILGDLFEYWLGDDCADKTAETTANTLRHYHQKTKVPLYFIHGNRDFLLGQDFADRCCMQILPELSEINLYGIKTLLMHGDTLCTDDKAYMQFRIKVRNLDWQARILRLPAWLRYLKALHMRWQSQRANAEKADVIMDVSQTSLDSIMQRHQVTQVIHGHTHRPAIHEWQIKGQNRKRCVVGDWYTQGSVLEVTSNHCTLVTLPLPT